MKMTVKFGLHTLAACVMALPFTQAVPVWAGSSSAAVASASDNASFKRDEKAAADNDKADKAAADKAAADKAAADKDARAKEKADRAAARAKERAVRDAARATEKAAREAVRAAKEAIRNAPKPYSPTADCKNPEA